ncbi:hypothetical protein HEK616_60760 [Streptomyces nigrescens]|uniref:Uncharacterized protein n=1 Tax=Streptomyces nigrescens TaxID=1920 RepID=A0ABM8A1R7_STRNI|nr:hypothetical protein HEK616_60760 [Streptomyces nigrescens]
MVAGTPSGGTKTASGAYISCTASGSPALNRAAKTYGTSWAVRGSAGGVPGAVGDGADGDMAVGDVAG